MKKAEGHNQCLALNNMQFNNTMPVQWNLYITDKLVQEFLSVIQRCSLLKKFHHSMVVAYHKNR